MSERYLGFGGMMMNLKKMFVETIEMIAAKNKESDGK